MGDIALAQGLLTTARDRYTEAVALAHEIRSIVQVIRHLMGVLEMLVRLDALDAQQAVGLVMVLRGHHAAASDTQKRADALLKRLGAEAQEKPATASTLTLDAVMPRLLATAAAHVKQS